MATLKSFDINIFDFNEFDGLEAYMDNLPSNIEIALNDALDEIAIKVKARMLQELNNYGLGDSSIGRTISIVAYPDGLFINVGADHATYVEFGTGIKGAGAPHPHPAFFGGSNSYATGPQSSKGLWWYPIDEGYAKANGIPYEIGNDGNAYSMTKGMESRPFIYKSYLYARRIVTRTINKHLGRVIG